jgi:predicted deacylase
MTAVREPFEIAGETVRPGTRQTVRIPVARLYTYTDMDMAVQVVHGRRDGPCLFVSAAVHGDELNGVEIIRRLLRRKVLARLRGTLLAVPVVNAFGLITQSRYLPDRRDLNRSFPGKESGSLTARLASTFLEEIVSRSTHGIDLHTGSNYRSNLPQLRATLDDELTLQLARAFATPVILDASTRDGSLREAVVDRGVPMLLYEAGEALRFDEVAIKVGLRGVMNVMRAIGMLPALKRAPPSFEPTVARKSLWVRSPRSGLLRAGVRLGEKVTRGAVVAHVADAMGTEDVAVPAPASGIVIGLLRNPLVYRGDALMHIARFDDLEEVEDTIEAFQDEYLSES